MQAPTTALRARRVYMRLSFPYLAACVVAALCAASLLGGGGHRQLAAAAARAQERAFTLERALAAERAARQRESKCCAAAMTQDAIRAAARAEVREILLHAARTAAGPPAGEPERLSSLGELARWEYAEAQAEEDPGWCRCPRAPNITALCRALGPAPVGWEAEALRCRGDVASCRSAVAEANLHAQEADERAAEARLQSTVRAAHAK